MSFDLTAIVRRSVGVAASTRNRFAAALIALFALGLVGAAPAATLSEAGSAQPSLAASTDLGPGHLQPVVTVMVELVDRPSALVYADALKVSIAQAGGNAATLSKTTLDSLKSAAAVQSRAQVARIESAQQALLPTLRSMASGGNILFRTKSAYNGVSMLANRDQIAALQKLPGVKAVHIQIPKFQTAATDIDFLGARTAWTQTSANTPYGVHGENVRIAIIDSGLDYIHTNFGGPGTNAAYASVTDTGPVPNPYFPSFKVPGGYDFAGDSYSAGVQDVPHPDANPLDSSNGHGTACASLIGGLGVASDGTTFVGVYDNLTNIASLRISPGFAPKAQLFPLRVFGVSGSTNLVTEAIDWAVDPNGDGNVADHMDVISMSLGANTGAVTDPDVVAAENAAAAGVIVASAAGNAGDSYYIVSSPSVGNGVLSVAATYNSTGGYFYNSNVTANSPAPVAGQKYPALYGSPSPAVPGGGLTGNIVYANPPDASSALTNAAAIAGNIAMIDRGTVSFIAKVQAAQAAGAVAVVIVQSAGGSGTPNPIVMALDATTSIPAMMIGLNEGNAIKAQLDPITRTGVNVTLNNDNGFVSLPSTAADTMPTYSARGPRLGDSMLKPDLSAPAEVVGVATSLSGNQMEGFNGTSSATPHVSGFMALLRQMHPTWTIEELMALAMNTATHDEFVGPSTGGGAQYGAGRVGAGRIDIGNASAANVVAYNNTDRGLVNVSFGIVEVPVASSVTLNKAIAIKNNGTSSVTYNVSYQDATPLAGATFTVGTGAPVTVAAGATVTIPVQFDATGSMLKHVREASVPIQLPAGQNRQWLSEKTGYAVLTPTGGPEPVLRVALYASPKPVSAMAAGTMVPGAPGNFTLPLTGTPVNTGASLPVDIVSLVKPFELQFRLPAVPPAPADPNVLKTVGVTSDYLERGASTANTVITFLVEGNGNASTPDYQSSDKEIYISLDGVSFQYAMYLGSVANGTATSNAYYPVIINLGTGAGLMRYRTNGFSSGSADTNAYNNSAVFFPVLATDIGLAGAAMPTSFQYEVVTFDRSGNLVDDSGVLSYNLAAPGVDAQGGNLDPFVYFDLTTTSIPVVFNGANLLANGSIGMVLEHLHNAAGAHTEVVTFAPPTLQSAVSRKVHGAAGTFDLPLSIAPAVNHNPTTEPRQGPTQTIVFTFDKPVSAATVTVSEGTATASAPSFSGNDVIVTLSGVSDVQYVTVDLSSVSSTDGGSGGTGSVRVGFLAGDVNQSRTVSLADVGLVNSVLAQTVTAANYLKDVNASGTLTLGDKAITNGDLTHALPTP
jgi:subtilisin family serine protease